MMITNKIVLYARFSSIGQKTGTSLQRQLEDGRAYCQSMGWQVTDELTDEGRSAYHGHHRSVGNLGKFEADALAGLEHGTFLVCENLDRLSRGDAELSYDFIRSLTRAGVSIATFHDSEFWDADKTSDIIKILKTLLTFQRANEESADKAKRSASNWAIKRKRAIEDGTPLTKMCPAWLTVEDGRYVVDQYRASLILDIFVMADSGMGSLQIVRTLNSRNEPTWPKANREKVAKCWHRSFIIRLLVNRGLIGECMVDGEPVKLYPPVIPADLFERVCANAEGRKAAMGGRKSKRMVNLLAGFCRCDVCNQPMQYGGGTGYLMCRMANSGSCTSPVHVPYKPLEKAILDSCLHLALDDNAFTNRTEVARLNVTIAERQSDLKAAQDKAKSLMNLYATQQSELAMQMALEAEERAKGLLTNLKALEEQREKAKGRASSLEHMQRVNDMRGRLKTDITLRKRVAQGLQTLITQAWFKEDNSVVVMLAGGLKALHIVDGVVIKQADCATMFSDGNLTTLNFHSARDSNAAPTVLKRITQAR